MTEIGRGGGVRIVEDGQRLLVLDARTAGLAVAIFVFALLAVIPGLAGGRGTLEQALRGRGLGPR